MSDAGPSSTLRVGAAWYPELWPEDQWARDIAAMKELGFNCVRLFEFAWGKFEPSEWQFEFDWAVRLLDMLRDAGIGVIICTPTAVPPAWMSGRYPEILRTRPDGKRYYPGQPGACSPVSTRFREFCTRIVDQMIHALRGHDAIIGWQIDSRMSGADFGAESRRAFHTWLSERFGYPSSLNSAWGLAWRGQSIDHFDQVPLPGQTAGSGPLLPEMRPHPALVVNFQRFANDQWSMFIQSQVELIRGSFEQPVTAVMSPGWSMNWFRLNHLLDRVSVAIPPADQGSARMLMHLDRARGEKSGTSFSCTDLVLNWAAEATVREILTPPQVASALWLGALSGSGELLFKNWRSHPAGQDMLEGALVTSTGKPAPNHAALAELKKIHAEAPWLAEHPPLGARVAIMVSNESAWMFSIDPVEEGFDYEAVWRDEFYLPLVRSHYWRDVIDQTQDYCHYQVLIAPLLPVRHRQTIDRLKEWVEQGGHLLIGPMTALRSEELAAFTDQELGGLEELIGATSAARFPARDPVAVVWEPKAGEPQGADTTPETLVPDSTGHGWCDGFNATTAQVLARYRGGMGDGSGAILLNRIGSGAVISVGCRVDPATYLDLIGALCDMANVKALAEGGDQVVVLPRASSDSNLAAYGLVNLSDQEQAIDLPQPGTDRLTRQPRGPHVVLSPREVLLIELQEAASTMVEANPDVMVEPDANQELQPPVTP